MTGKDLVPKGKLARRMVFALSLLGILLLIGIPVSESAAFRNWTMGRYEEFAFSYTKLAADYIDGDKAEEYLKTGEEDDYYYQICDYADAMVRIPNVKYFYVFYPAEDGLVYIWDGFTEDYEKRTGLLEKYDYSEDGGYEQSMDAFRVDAPEKFSSYEESGGLATAMTPLLNSKGDPVAVVAMDVALPRINAAYMSLLKGVLWVVVAILLVAMVGLYISISRRVIRPIYKLQEAADNLVDNLEDGEPFKSDIQTNDEIETLAHSFEKMDAELRGYIAENAAITAEKERIGAELSLATEIQASALPSIFPPFPEKDEFDIFASMTPAKEVGGDFYDFFLIDDDHLGLVIADVSGKGVPAALFMMISMVMINTNAMMGDAPNLVMERVNNRISKNNENSMFVTVWFGVLELSTGKVHATNAGHEYPVIRQPNGKFEILKDKHGFVVGGMEGIPYTEYEFTLEHGSTLFVYTDGVPEATDANDELYGMDRLVDALNNDPDADVETLLNNVHKDVNTFVGDAPQFDDLTMLAIKYK